MPKIQEVFGVSNKMIDTYLVREQVDGKMQAALASDKHIVIYGTSKQGKTLLLNKCLAVEDRVTFNCSLDTEVIDIYSSIVRQLGIQIERNTNVGLQNKSSLSPNMTATIKVPKLFELSGNAGGSLEEVASDEIEYENITYDLSKAQDVSELLKEKKLKKKIIIEDFHYLSQEIQEKLAFDLKSFYENGVIFIILGVWKEKNKLIQYNRDLTDRLESVSVEPWNKNDFVMVIEKGAQLLDLEFPEDIREEIIKNSFDNIGILQELCKCCSTHCLGRNGENIDSSDLKAALAQKREDYSIHHRQILERIANGSTGVLFLPYYLVQVILETNNDKLKKGLSKKYIQYQITQRHYDKSKVRTNDVTKLLHHHLKEIQYKLKITPPIFDYDIEDDNFRILDSTLFYYFYNSDKEGIEENMQIPDELEDILNEVL
ncbi:hypothetical protein [uncultured Enterococcus sp.]|uniref:hypothetical protein n=1 Tax=uncultured Enterococcus sp. TaxID=167972 RepID=UPI002AA6C6A6|nr:hypothetical protein [uncultured Enterococcus sp.]